MQGRSLIDWLEEATAFVERRWGTDRFTNGDCHVLAMALHKVIGRQGSLWACLRHEMDEDGELFSTTYSHMVYSPPDDSSWDIEGPGADERWVAQFDDDAEPDEDGLVNEFEWVQVPSREGDYSDTRSWLRLHRANDNLQLMNDIAQELQALPRFAA
jgi:hypothetical protein